MAKTNKKLNKTTGFSMAIQIHPKFAALPWSPTNGNYDVNYIYMWLPEWK